jgi:hypothetical protein
MINVLVKRIGYFILLALIGSCASKVGSQTQSSGYSEDISLFRPMYPDPQTDTGSYPLAEVEQLTFVEPTASIAADLDSLLDSIASYTRSRGYYQVYTIQIYNGTSSTAANDAKALAYREFSDLIPVLEYQQPIFKVKVGLFYERLDAQKTLEKMRKVFQNAILIPERVY